MSANTKPVAPAPTTATVDATESAVRAYRRKGRPVRGYVRSVPVSAEAAIEAQCAAYDALDHSWCA
jgi:hypothetical protein